MNTATTGAPQLPPGTVIDGTYTTGAVVRSRLGAVTYEATDLSGARVGVTVYAPECFVSPVALERSLRELRQVEKVHAPQVLRCIDAGKLMKGGIYEVHENVTGPSLAEGLVAREEVSGLIHEIVAGLQAAQKVGVLHRNLGAESVLRVGDGVKLTGFAVGDPQGGVSFGSLDCIAPEQVEGRNIDERTLVYNLAALTYLLLRGASLFTGGDTGTQLLQAAASLPEPESMPPALFAALAKDPKARPNLLAKFLGDLDAIIREFPDSLPAPTRAADRDAPSAARAADREAPSAPLFRLDPLPADNEQVRPSSVREAAEREPAAESESATNRAPAASNEREDDATLDALMADNDAPNSLSSATAAPAASQPTPAAAPAATVAATAAAAALPPAGAKPVTALPNLSAKPAPTLAPPPGLGKPAAPTIGAPPSLGKPAVPTIGAPPTLPTLSAPSLGAPLSAPPLGAPSLTPPTFGAPTLSAPITAPASNAAAAPPAVAAAPATVGAAKPRTRGWTMFMEVTEDEANSSAMPGLPQAGAPAQPTPAPAPTATAAPTPTPAPAQPKPAPGPGGEVKPSTRGWTMIMDEPEADPSALALTNPAAAAATVLPPSPTTRGWTMLEELNDSLPAGAVPATPTPTPTPSQGVTNEASGVSNAPSSRGWTMFMEAELQGGAQPAEGTPAEPQEAEPEDFEGEVTTDTGTVITLAPTAAEPNASFRREPDLSGSEPMTSFGARLRGEPEAKPSKPLEDEIPQPRPVPLESVPSPSAEIPSFADNNLNLIPVDPNKSTVPIKAQPLEPDAVDPEPTPSGSGAKVAVGLLVILAIVLAILYATSR